MNILELSETRFSARKYTAEPVAQSDLEYIMECVRLAPSAVNKQPWKFVIVRSEEAKQKLWRAYDREWFRTAPLYIVCMKNNNACWTRSYDDKKHGDVDVAIATEHLCLAATERGLGTCWVCNYDTSVMNELFASDDFETVAMANAQEALKKVYNENINPMEQIDNALVKAKADGKYVVCQVGGNWCPWCLRFADFVEKDQEVSKMVSDNFELIHVNYDPRKSGGDASANNAAKLMERLGNPARFGFPVFVVLDSEGNVLHIQDSSFLEEGKGYSEKKVLRFFKNWTPKAVENKQ